MNKQMTISIISVLAIGVIVAGILYAQETGKLKDAQSEIVTLEENVSALESDGSVLKGEISALETELADAEAEVSTLEGDLADAEAKVSTLEGDLAAAEAQVSTLEADLAVAEAQVSTLEANLAAAEARAVTLEARLSTLERALVEAGLLVTIHDANLEAAIREAIYYATTPGGQGQAIFENTCMMCHTIGGGILVGPDLKDITSRRDRDWLISFIISPEQLIAQEDPLAIQLVAEFNGFLMPTFGLSAEEAEAVLVYIEAYIPQGSFVDKHEGPIYKFNLEAITILETRGRGISDITSLEYCINLQELYLRGNNISDISVLAGLTNLSSLSLTDNNISDISALAGLTNLETLGLGGNNISDISALAGLIDLNELWLWENNISGISSLAGLTTLQGLDLGENNISDISVLAGLTNLQWLYLYDMNLSDISALAGLTNLQELLLDGNNISDISPLVANSGLSAGDTVDLSNNPLSTTSVNVYIPQLEARGVNVIYE